MLHTIFLSEFIHILISLCPYFQYAEDLESGFSSDVESKYKKIYEDDINPFAAFSKKVDHHFLSLVYILLIRIASFLFND